MEKCSVEEDKDVIDTFRKLLRDSTDEVKSRFNFFMGHRYAETSTRIGT